MSKEGFFTVPSSKPARKSAAVPSPAHSSAAPHQQVSRHSSAANTSPTSHADSAATLAAPATRPGDNRAAKPRPQRESHEAMLLKLKATQESIDKAHGHVKSLVPIINDNRALINKSYLKETDLKSHLLAASDPISDFQLLRKVAGAKAEVDVVVGFHKDCVKWLQSRLEKGEGRS